MHQVSQTNKQVQITELIPSTSVERFTRKQTQKSLLSCTPVALTEWPGHKNIKKFSGRHHNTKFGRNLLWSEPATSFPPCHPTQASTAILDPSPDRLRRKSRNNLTLRPFWRWAVKLLFVCLVCCLASPFTR